MEFPPHQSRARRLTNALRFTDLPHEGYVFDYADAARSYIDRPEPEYPLFRAVMTGWDNTPRRQRRGYVFLGSTPERYGEWLAEAVRQTRERHPPDRRLVFINAWNEWAEGAHLEPDQRYKRAYLEATQEAMRRSTSSGGSSSPSAPLSSPRRRSRCNGSTNSSPRRSSRAGGMQALSLGMNRGRRSCAIGSRLSTTSGLMRPASSARRSAALSRTRQPLPPRDRTPHARGSAARLSRGLDRVPAIKSALRAMMRKGALVAQPEAMTRLLRRRR